VTLARSERRRKGAKPLFNKGRFRNSIAWTVRGDTIIIGTNVVYARIHQYGGYAGRGRKVRIPARPYLGITEEDRREAESLLREWLGGR
ncbi:phage virion morphogenesis protein, partial [Fervidobacterium sp.]